MKTLLSIILFSCIALHSMSQIEGVIVENYYIADENDATDTIGGGIESGTVTYRIYIDLAPNSKILSIYGNKNHPLKFSSTQKFFNHIDRGQTFGYSIQSRKLDENTLALDTWITIGQAGNRHMGVLKSLDTTTSIVGGAHNDGGSEEIPTGLLRNFNDTITALTLQDGLIEIDESYVYTNIGFTDIISGKDSTIFGHLKNTNEFYSEQAVLMSDKGIAGYPENEKHVLIAQLSTKGAIAFELNVEVLLEDSSIVKYVANDSILLEGEKLSPFLKYPFECGCIDPDYLEYSNRFACNDENACKTPIVFGCMDLYACNYDEKATFHVDDLCCYPGFCNNRDIEYVCNESLEITPESEILLVYPNPSNSSISIHKSLLQIENTEYTIINTSGDIEKTGQININNNSIDVSDLKSGVYIFMLLSEDFDSILFYKK